MISGVTNIGCWQCPDRGLWQSGCYHIIPNCGKLGCKPVVTGQAKAVPLVTGQAKSEPLVTGKTGSEPVVTGVIESEPKVTGVFGTPICGD